MPSPLQNSSSYITAPPNETTTTPSNPIPPSSHPPMHSPHMKNPPTLFFHSLALILFLYLSSTLTITNSTSTTCSHCQPLLPISTTNATTDDHLHTYIIHVQHPNNGSKKLLSSEEQSKWYKSFLPSTTANSGKPRLLYSYHHTISGFAARLSRHELEAVESMHGFVHATPDRLLTLHTTHTNDFLGLNQGSCFQRDSGLGKGMIIGVLDTGIAPAHPSFRDAGLPHPPARWKGHCDFKPGECNNKLIGAKSFLQGRKDLPADAEGHGSHTAGIAAGSPVAEAEVLGNARGTAAGVAPAAHLAVYKVCHPECWASDVLAGIDQAVADGVDVISVSFGGGDGRPVPLYDDAVAIGSLAAVEKGVFVSCSAGNGGPRGGTVENDAPWVLTVGASTMDRSMRATVRLGNGGEFGGESAYHPSSGFTASMLPVVYPGARGGSRAKACSDGSLNHVNVRGKIVVCRNAPGPNSTVEKGAVVRNAGGVAMILVNEAEHRSTMHAAAHVLPTSHVSHSDGLAILSYIESSSNPTATIVFEGTLYGISPSPAVAAFSSRGPSRVNEGVLKPDIVGPGVNILAAWPLPVGPLAGVPASNSTPTFNILSGTSMSAPLLAGVATLLKVSHPSWSPAAIKSAIMTTADIIDRDGRPITGEMSSNISYFATGAGHVNPSKANDPGLVYDIAAADYVAYLCGLEYTDKQVSAVTRQLTQCSTVDVMSAEELNYPSISVSMGPNGEKTVTRTVTNVGEADSVYTVQIGEPEGVKVTVYPNKLSFSETNENVSYNVYLSTRDTGGKRGSASQGELRWVSSKHIVRSPFSITFT